MEPDEAEVEQLAADFGELPPQAAAEIRKFLRKFLEVLAGQKILVRQCDEATARHEKMMRTLAEIDNIRKRTMEEVDLARKYAAEAFAISICDVRDCLEIAMESDPEKPDDLREGVSLTLRKLDGVMERHGVREVNPDVGAGFDPALCIRRSARRRTLRRRATRWRWWFARATRSTNGHCVRRT